MSNDRPDVATLAARLNAVERALTDETRTAPRPAAEPGPAPTAPESPAPSSSADSSAASDAPDAASERPHGRADGDAVRRLERRVEELTAELDAVRGLLGGVEAVNEAVERRADLALAAVEEMTTERAEAGLVVERLPDGGDAFGDPPARDDAAAREGDRRDDSTADSLAARLRGAL